MANLNQRGYYQTQYKMIHDGQRVSTFIFVRLSINLLRENAMQEQARVYRYNHLPTSYVHWEQISKTSITDGISNAN